jgi:hypothetical protein
VIIRTRTPQQDARRARLVAALVHWQPDRADERSAADHAAWQAQQAERNQRADDAALYGSVGRDDRNVGY